MPQRTYDPGYPLRLTSHFGEIRQGENGPTKHSGVDFGASEGTAIPAANDGKVAYCRENHGGYGYTVIIEHRNPNGSRFYTLYAHMNHDPQLTPDSEVKAGQKIGEVGTTTGRKDTHVSPHLHFEVLQPEGEDSNGPFFGSWRDKKRLTFMEEDGSLGIKGNVGRVNPETFTNYRGEVFGKGHPDHRVAADERAFSYAREAEIARRSSSATNLSTSRHQGDHGSDNGTLVRHGGEVTRIEPNGSTRGSFHSE